MKVIVLRFFFFMLQTYLFGSRKPQKKFCVPANYRFPERTEFRRTMSFFVLSKFQVHYVFSEAKNIKLYTVLSHFEKCWNLHKKCFMTAQIKEGGIACIWTVYSIKKSFNKGRHKNVFFLWKFHKLKLTPPPPLPLHFGHTWGIFYICLFYKTVK